ncbi:MAG: hypothetical protein GXP55_06185 [Deltaproteobacteria bacterium]|nr:hypothetical protein [Deltaproteobacteria bacterium]
MADEGPRPRVSRSPQELRQRLERSLELHAHPALEASRWARPGEEPAHSAAVAVAWDLVTQQASAEANMLNRAMRELETEPERVLLAAMVAAGARATSVGGLCVTAKSGQRWWPRDLAFIPGRDHPTPELSMSCCEEVDRVIFSVFLRQTHVGYVLGHDEQDEPEELRVERTLGVLLMQRPPDERTREEVRRDREIDLAMQAEGHLLERVLVADLWSDPMGRAAQIARRLDDACREDVERAKREAGGERALA